MRARLHGRECRGFTLVEMLAALAVFSILGLALAAMLSGSLATWQKDEARNERRLVARRSINLIAQDLRLAALPANRSDTNNLQFVIDPQGTGLSGYLLPQAFFGQAPMATDLSSATSQGDLAVFGYFVRWVGTEACLCRLLVNPSATDYRVYTNPTNWVTSQVLDTNAPGLMSTNSYGGLVGENVLGLWAQALDVNGNPIVKTAGGSTYAVGAYDSRLGYSISTNGNTVVYAPSSLPAAIRIGLVVVDNQAAKHIKTALFPAALTTNFFGDIQKFVGGLPGPVQKGTEVYTQVVPLDHFSP